MKVLLERTKLRMNQKAFAKKLGISNVTLVKIEKGELDTLKIGTLKKVAEALNSTVQELFFSEED